MDDMAARDAQGPGKEPDSCGGDSAPSGSSGRDGGWDAQEPIRIEFPTNLLRGQINS